jgi:hypothetical protein
MTTAIKSVSVGLELLSWVEKYKISLSEAVRVGVSVILAEMGETEFLNRVNLGRKVQKMAAVIEDLNKKLENFENVVQKK